jgi:hypothetical protein
MLFAGTNWRHGGAIPSFGREAADRVFGDVQGLLRGMIIERLFRRIERYFGGIERLLRGMMMEQGLLI